ncbi:MAG: hypothetical protein WC285_00810 [Candidatus Gracilibacteria bacterium]|jgi:hypothetical protein
MFKKTILTLIALIIITINIQAAYGYSIPADFRPINAPMAKLNYGEPTETVTNTILQIIAGTLLYFAAPIAVFSIAQSAFMMAMSGADTEKVEQGKKHLTWAIIGLVTIIFSYSIVRVIIGFVVDVGNYSTDFAQTQPAAPAPATTPTPAAE